VTVVCPLCEGMGFLDDFEMTPCPAGCETCWKCQGTKEVTIGGCFAMDGLDCCGGFCTDMKEPCDRCLSDRGRDIGERD
jgi:hypothetical protein